MKEGRVIKCVAGAFTVRVGTELLVVPGRGKNKLEDKILPGDFVRYDEGKGIIDSVLPRKNSLIRPAIANLDALIILAAPVPAPDFLLLDKLIIFCKTRKIEPILVYNKTDLNHPVLAELLADYGEDVEAIIDVSAKLAINLERLKNAIKGKFSALAGQSAVGKSTLLNALTGTDSLETGEMSKRTDRGRHTTRQTELFDLGEGTVIADTPGFSFLTISGIGKDDLALYYDGYVRLADSCRFHPCTHRHEPDCAVRAELARTLSATRHARYLELYTELEREEKKYF